MKREFFIETTDGKKLSAFSWEPENKTAEAVIVLVHGLGEHTGRYLEMAEYFAESGIALFAMDLRGHGKSPGKKGHTAPRNQILEDVDLLCKTAVTAYPDASLFLYGHSMGGNIGLSHRMYGKIKPKGYIISAPWLILHDKIPAFQVSLIKLLSKFAPDLCINNKLDTGKLSKDLTQIDCDKDPLYHGFISVQTALDCNNYANDILRNSSQEYGDMLLLHGTDDLICSVEGSRAFMRNAPASVSFVEWKDSYHEIHHDKDRYLVREQIKKWVLERA